MCSQQNEDSKVEMEAAKQRGEDMRNNVDTFRRQLTQQVESTYHYTPLTGVM